MDFMGQEKQLHPELPQTVRWAGYKQTKNKQT